MGTFYVSLWNILLAFGRGKILYSAVKGEGAFFLRLMKRQKSEQDPCLEVSNTFTNTKIFPSKRLHFPELLQVHKFSVLETEHALKAYFYWHCGWLQEQHLNSSVHTTTSPLQADLDFLRLHSVTRKKQALISLHQKHSQKADAICQKYTISDYWGIILGMWNMVEIFFILQ